MKSMEGLQGTHKAEKNRKRYEQENRLEQEHRLLKSYYPQAAGYVQAFVEDACDRLDYEGSYIYDEYPDKWSIERSCKDICTRIQNSRSMQAMDFGGRIFGEEGLAEITAALFCQELYRRRCRRARLKRI